MIRENRQLSFEQRRRQESIVAIEATDTTEASRAYAGMAALMGSYFDAMVLKLSDFFRTEATHPNRRHTLYTLLQRASPEAIAHVTLRQIVRRLTRNERNGQKKDGSDEDESCAVLHTNIAIDIGNALRNRVDDHAYSWDLSPRVRRSFGSAPVLRQIFSSLTVGLSSTSASDILNFQRH